MEATLGSGSDLPRLPASSIPEDLTCTLCDPPVQMTKIGAYKGHMHFKHGIHFEVSETTKMIRAAVPKDAERLIEAEDLPVWMKVAIIKHEIFGESYTRVAEEMGKSAATISSYARTPAGIKAIKSVKEMTDMKSLIKVMMEGALTHMYADWLMALEWAKHARDYKMIHTMIKDVGLQPILQDAKNQNSAPTTLILNLGSSDLKTVEAQTAYVVDAIVEPDDAGGY